MKLKSLWIFSFCLLLTGCGFFSKSFVDETSFSAYPAPDPEIKQMLDAYRDSLHQVMGQKIATVRDTLRFGKPESALSNLVADALRFRAARELRVFVHVGVIDKNSFKLFFVPGELTLGDVYEFMPYRNHLVILTLKGRTLLELVEQIASIGGAPISGVRFRIDENGNPNSILVNAEVIDLNKDYLVATSSWISNGGGRFPALWNAEDRMDTGISLQNVFVNYFGNQVELFAITDGRIRR